MVVLYTCIVPPCGAKLREGDHYATDLETQRPHRDKELLDVVQKRSMWKHQDRVGF